MSKLENAQFHSVKCLSSKASFLQVEIQWAHTIQHFQYFEIRRFANKKMFVEVIWGSFVWFQVFLQSKEANICQMVEIRKNVENCSQLAEKNIGNHLWALINHF